MTITHLNITNLRNHYSSAIDFGKGLNVLYGMNGAGKTTVLEAISICSLSKSFLPAADSSLARNGEGSYLVAAEAQSDLSVPYRISVKYSIGSRKNIASSLGGNLNPSDIIGVMPAVVLSPDYKSITFGSPQERRGFVDMLLCQTSRAYLDELNKFRKALKQRNNLLQLSKGNNNAYPDELRAWSKYFSESASNIVWRRYSFIEEYVPYFQDAYEKIAGSLEPTSLQYMPNGFNGTFPGNISSPGDINRIFLDLSKVIEKEEIRRGITLFGPQKDELKIMINGGTARDYASQGQHKSLLIALKFAEFEFLKSKRNETPIILLDDIFSELDQERSSRVLNLLLETPTQAFITSADFQGIQNLLPLHSYSYYLIEKGRAIKI